MNFLLDLLFEGIAEAIGLESDHGIVALSSVMSLSLGAGALWFLATSPDIMQSNVGPDFLIGSLISGAAALVLSIMYFGHDKAKPMLGWLGAVAGLLAVAIPVVWWFASRI